MQIDGAMANLDLEEIEPDMGNTEIREFGGDLDVEFPEEMSEEGLPRRGIIPPQPQLNDEEEKMRLEDQMRLSRHTAYEVQQLQDPKDEPSLPWISRPRASLPSFHPPQLTLEDSADLSMTETK